MKISVAIDSVSVPKRLWQQSLSRALYGVHESWRPSVEPLASSRSIASGDCSKDWLLISPADFVKRIHFQADSLWTSHAES
jgi:hypothetical protein